MDKSYQDPAKQLSREKLREFIKKTILYRVKAPEDIKVACFPGEELLEVTEVYDKLGIPRQNIYGIEKEEGIVDRLMGKNYGINVFHIDALDFFSTTKQRFDVVSLDYTGKRGPREEQTVKQIAGRQLLGSKSVLSTNFFGKRETENDKEFLRVRGLEEAIMEGVYERRRVSEVTGSLLDRHFSDMEELRNSTTFNTIRIMLEGRASTNAIEFFKDANPNYDQTTDLLRKLWTGWLKEDAKLGEIKKYEKIGVLKKGFSEEVVENPESAIEVFNTMQFLSFLQVLKERGFGDILALGLTLGASNCYREGYISERIERYKYVSNTGSPMNMDLFYLDQHNDLLDKFWNAISFFNKHTRNNTTSIGVYKSTEMKLAKAVKKYSEARKHAFKIKDTKRIFLGSSFVPPKRKDRLSKKDALDLLSAGCTPVEISEVYSGFTKMQLAAFKAHMTMGTYTSKSMADSAV